MLHKSVDEHDEFLLAFIGLVYFRAFPIKSGVGAHLLVKIFAAGLFSVLYDHIHSPQKLALLSAV